VKTPTGKHCLAFAFHFSLRLTHRKHAHPRGPKKILHVFLQIAWSRREKGKEKAAAHKAFLVLESILDKFQTRESYSRGFYSVLTPLMSPERKGMHSL
jgi:hypothetical protein